MVNAVIHIICGNCGSLDLKYARDNNVFEEEDNIIDNSSIDCENCGTMHFMNEMPQKKTPLRGKDNVEN